MQPEFWHSRWGSNQIGFHQEEVNPYLSRWWGEMGLQPGSRVLVPLCGKSLDLSWLAAQGFDVMGVELSSLAVEDYFREQGVQPVVTERGAFKVYETGPVTIWCGDIFKLSAADVETCQGVYDRAAMIAFPQDMREQYALHLSEILPLGCKGLLITLDYDQSQKQGPPFSVPDAQVQQWLSPVWTLEVLEELDVLANNWKFLKNGLTRLVERVYRLEKPRGA